MSIICESGIGHAVGEIAEIIFNTYTGNAKPVLGYIIHEGLIEPIFDYITCYTLHMA